MNIYDEIVIKILLYVAKIFSRSGNETYAHEIEKIEKEIFNKGEEK